MCVWLSGCNNEIGFWFVRWHIYLLVNNSVCIIEQCLHYRTLYKTRTMSILDERADCMIDLDSCACVQRLKTLRPNSIGPYYLWFGYILMRCSLNLNTAL